MENGIISYLEMCHREGVNLQQGMNYRLGDNYSVILMSLRPNAPYRDEVSEDGMFLIYEGHDVPKRNPKINPKSVDQPQFSSAGKLTQNGKFDLAACQYKEGKRPPERVCVYEKIRKGIWSYNGLFELIDSWKEFDGRRHVFKLKAIGETIKPEGQGGEDFSLRRRIIPTSVKLEVWKRDEGKCVVCGATDELHFDHIIPYSKGGTSIRSDNIQLLCARHNLGKRDKIE